MKLRKMFFILLQKLNSFPKNSKFRILDISKILNFEFVTLSKEQKVGTLEEQKFQEKLLERMEHQDKTFNETMYGLQGNMAHLAQTVSQAFITMTQGSFSTQIPATPRQDFPNFPMTPRFICPMPPSSIILITLVDRQITMEIIHQVKMILLVKLMIIQKTKTLTFQCEKTP